MLAFRGLSLRSMHSHLTQHAPKYRFFTLFLALILFVGVLTLMSPWNWASLAARRAVFSKSSAQTVTAGKPASLKARTGVAGLRQDPAAPEQCSVNCTATVPGTGQAGAAVNFAATATTSGCSTQPSFEWNFGDGTTRSQQQNPSHTYSSAGTYTWTLTTTVGTGGTVIDTVAGGLGEGNPVRQAPLGIPAAIARDPQGRGIYVADTIGGTTYIRFINTSTSTVTIAGRTIAAGTIRAVAGGGQDIGENISGLTTDLGTVTGLAVNSAGTILYYVARIDGQVRALNVSDSPVTIGSASIGAGNIGTLASNFGNGAGANSGLGGLAFNGSTGDLFVADATAGINKVYRISSGGTVATAAGSGATTKPEDSFSGGNALNVPLLQPSAVKIDGAGNLLIADTGHARVIRVDSGGTATLVYQFTVGQQAPNPYPSALTIQGGNVFAANGNSQAVVRVTGGVTTVAGTAGTACDYSVSNCGDGGPGNAAGLNMLGSISNPPYAGIESDNGGIFILDQGVTGRGRVRYLNLTGGALTLAGTTVPPGAIETIAGNGGVAPYDGGLATGATFSTPTGVAVDANGNLWVSDTISARLRFVNRSPNQVTIFPGTASAQDVPAGQIVTVNRNVGGGNTDGVPVIQAGFDSPQGLFITNQGIFVADSKGGPNVPPQQINSRRTSLIRFINTSSSTVTFYPGSAAPISVPPGQIAKIAGGGENTANGDGGFALAAKFVAASDVVVDGNGNIYVADVGQNAVRKISANTGVVASLALTAKQYTGLGLGPDGRLYIANYTDNTVLRENSAGSGTFTSLATGGAKPRDVAVDASGNAYVTMGPASVSGGNHQIVLLPASGSASVIAGAAAGFAGDGGAAASARLNISPSALVVGSGTTNQLPETVNIVVAANGSIFFTDSNNNRIRRLSTSLSVCTKTGTITISGDNPAPQITSLNPTSVLEDSGAFTLTVNGSGFVPASKVRWNGQERTTTYVSGTQLTASITGADVSSAGTAAITVFNPAPGGGTSNAVNFTISQPNPVPAITSITPNSAVEGSSAFTLTVNGTGFVNGSQVRWDGTARQTTFVSATQLTAQILASDLVGTGQAGVSVFNPTPGGGVSNVITFNITSGQNPVPTLSSINPTSVTAGSAAFTLTATGSNFVASSKVRWNGADLTTNFVSATQLTASVPASLVTAAGTAQVTVFTPTPGGGVSAAQTFTITQAQNPSPTLTSINPTSATAGGAGFTLTANGANFLASSTVRWNGSNLVTSFVSATQLTASVPASLIASAGTAQVTVFNPAPGGGTSSVVSFTVNPAQGNPVPTVTTLNPSAVLAGGASFVLTVDGTNFVNGAVVRLNNNNRSTTFVSATRLTAAILPSDIASVGNLSITVFNPAPGGGVSNAVTLPVVGQLASISAASYLNTAGFAPESIVAGFGVNLATGVEVASTVPLPTSLLGTRVRVRDSAGTERDAPLFFVAPTQINYMVPAGTVDGAATVSVTVNNTVVALGSLSIGRVGPGLFSANASGQGVAAAVVLRVKAGGVLVYENVSQAQGGTQVPIPIDLGPEGETVYVLLYGTGLRNRSAAAAVQAEIGGITKTLNPGNFEDAGAVGGFAGLDQANVILPRSLGGRGLVNVRLTIDGKASNIVQLSIK